MNIELSDKNPKIKWLLISLLVAGVALALLKLNNSDETIQREDLILHPVQQGDVDIYTQVYGELVSAKEQLINAPAMGNVTQIHVLPGTEVSSDTVILTLSNPQLEEQYRQSKGTLAKLIAEREGFKYQQQNDKLSAIGRIQDIESSLEQAQLERSVQTRLKHLGVAANIELQRSELAVKQQSVRLQFEQQRLEQFVQMQQHNLKQRDIAVQQQQQASEALQKQLEKMHIKAGMPGSLQSLEIELGENVQLGQILARVGSNKTLIARLRLPRNQADQVNIDASVIITTPKGTMQARVKRIESVVRDGAVLADAHIEGPLLANARPSLTISAQVFIKMQKDALYIKSFVGGRPDSQQSIFVLRNNGFLQKTDTSFGPLSLNKQIITEGVIVGDRVAQLNTSNYTDTNKISLTD